MKFTGKCRKFGDNVNTDEIIPARYLNTSNPEELAKHCMEDADPDFVRTAKAGDIIVAGRNFGCGSSREHAPIALKTFGIACVIADSFARIFFRNAINIGLPLVELKDTDSMFKPGDIIDVDFKKGVVRNLTAKKSIPIVPLPDFMEKILKNGGLMNSLKLTDAGCQGD